MTGICRHYLALPFATSLLFPFLVFLPFPSGAEAKEHERLEDIRLSTPSGVTAGLPNIGDRRLFLQFRANWCRSCSVLIETLDELTGDFPQVTWLVISIDEGDSEAVWERLDAHPVFRREKTRFFHDDTGLLADRLAVSSVPSLLVLDEEGREEWRHVGHVNSSDLAALKSALQSTDKEEEQ